MQLHPDIEIILSTTADGSLRSSVTPASMIRDVAARQFLARHHIATAEATLLRLSYASDDFCKYHEVTRQEIGAGFETQQHLVADGLVTHQRHTALFLPIADCIGAVLYHASTGRLMLSHLGRHNLEQYGGMKSVEYMAHDDVDPAELLVYLSPAAQAKHYPLYSFDNRSLHEVAVEQLVAAGVVSKNIIVDARDTVTDPDFFSHSASLRGDKLPGRHALMCYIKT